MTGLDKITGEINSESEKIASEILENAKAESDRILADAKKEATEICEKINREVSVRLSAGKSSAESAVALRKRRLMLSEKQKLIGEVINEAKQIIYSLPDDTYFDKLLILIEKNATSGKGTIVFNSKDLERLPSNFEARLQAISEKKGGSLTVSKETRTIDGGFILLYDGINQNCSISSLFETNIEKVQDKIQDLLF